MEQSYVVKMIIYYSGAAGMMTHACDPGIYIHVYKNKAGFKVRLCLQSKAQTQYSKQDHKVINSLGCGSNI